MPPAHTTYLFYDIETTGLNKCFDQVLQFAAIRTDLAFNEVSRYEFQIKLNCDVIPSPGAIITHRIAFDALFQGISELEAMEKIHALLNTPGTISIGYNSLGFDDELLRFSFYKNLLPPYTHQYANGCGRMDLYPITVLYYLFNPDIVHWPIKNDAPSLKLEHLNAENQFAEGQSHTAMVDVEITLALAKKLAKDLQMWNYITDYFQKSIDEKRIQNTAHRLEINGNRYILGLMAHGKIGSTAQFIAPVMQLGQHLHYKNQSLWLRLDEPVSENAKVMRKRLAEPPIFLPLKDRYEKYLSPERKKITEDNKIWLQDHLELFEHIKQFHLHEKYPEVPNKDSDAALYDLPFATPHEEKIYRQFHHAKPDEKINIVRRFANVTRQQQGMRILARHFPDTLTAEETTQFENYLHSSPIDYRGEKKLTKSEALSEINILLQKNTLDEEQQALLQELKRHLLQ